MKKKQAKKEINHVRQEETIQINQIVFCEVIKGLAG